MKYLINLACDGHYGIGGSFSDGKYAFEVRADNMSEAKQMVIDRAIKDGFYGLDNTFTADIVRLLPSGRIDTGINFYEVFSAERNQTLKLA